MSPNFGGWSIAADPLSAAGVLLAAVCCAGVGLWWSPPPPGRGRTAAIAGLRLAAVGLVAVLLLDPVRRRGGTGEPVPLPALLDVSDSMTGGEADSSRLDAAAELLRGWEMTRPLAVRRFARTPDAAATDGTDPAAAVRAALGDPAVRRAGALVVVTDGRSTVGPAGKLSAAADAAAEAGVRLLIVAVGEPDPLGGVRLADLSATRPIGPGEPVTVAARWTFADPPPDPPPLTATLTDRPAGALVVAGPVTITADGVAVFAATFAPPTAGPQIFDLTLEARGESPPAGAGTLTLDVPGDRVRVFLAADRPRHEVRFLRDLLEREPTIDLTASVGPTPAPADSGEFDVRIAVGEPEFAEEPNAAAGRIVVRVPTEPGNPPSEPAPVAATAAGRRLGLFTADPPPIFEAPPTAAADPAAAVLAIAGGEPLVTLRRTAGGATVAVRSPQTWRWRDAPDDDPHRRFWLAAVRLAAAGPDAAPGLRVEPGTIPAGGAATVTAEGAALSAVRVEGPGVRRTLPLGPGGAATVDGLPPGRFRLVPVGEGGGPAAELTVTAPPGERDDRSQDRADLRAAAERSGGRYVPLAEAAAARGFLPPPAAPPTADRLERLAESWPPVALLAGLLGCEWLLRRRGGGV